MSENYSYEEKRVEPFKPYIGAKLIGVVLKSEVDCGAEPNDLILSFEGLPDLCVSAWGGIDGNAGFDIEAVRPSEPTEGADR